VFEVPLKAIIVFNLFVEVPKNHNLAYATKCTTIVDEVGLFVVGAKNHNNVMLESP
jgi:hypothetical protein